ncbi:hypothetical protein AALP_AA6G198500 [Arabis alpina]|uniref:Uncharacterized protein n=1 Tax=Arabis alpina TaxID=50452 RepID=A0A087GQE4_ARAAL|nr:hypothetical protein AALP_AA6G198500 [Arabis alpina]
MDQEKGRRRCCLQLSDLALHLLYPERTKCSLSIFVWQQMDVEYTFWQMLNLCLSPKVVFCWSFSSRISRVRFYAVAWGNSTGLESWKG